MRKETSIWFDQAEEDFKSIDSLLKDKRYHGAVLLTQQAVEKILKAYIIEKNQKMPLKTHRIEKLIYEAHLDLKEIKNPNVVELSKAYTWVRYPDLSRKHFPTQQDAENLIQVANNVYLWIKQKLIN